MADMGALYQAAQQMMQNYDIDSIIAKDQMQDLQALLAEKVGVKADAKESQQKGEGVRQHILSKNKMKKKAQGLKKLVKAAPTPETKEVKEVEGKKPTEEELSFEEMIKELKEKRLPQDEQLNRYENARFVMELADEDSSSSRDIIEYLIQPTGPYGKRPDHADKCLKTAIDATEKQVKMLTAKHGADHGDVAAAKARLGKLQDADAKLMSHIDTNLASQYTGTSVGRTLLYKSKIRQDTLRQVPLFQNEEELKKALQELDNLIDPTAHYQWSSKYDYKQILAVYNEYARETSEILNSEGTNIPPGLLANRIKILQNNTSFKFVNRVFGNELVWGMKQWSTDIGNLALS